MGSGVGNPLQAGAPLSNATPIVESGSGTAGTATSAARADHVHPASASGPDLSDATPLEESGAGSAGVSADASRADHVHPAAAASAGPSSITITLSADGTGADGAIVGSAAGALAHAEGVLLGAAVPGKRYMVIELVCRYAYSTAQYGGGGNLNACLWDGATAPVVTVNLAGASTIGGTTSRTGVSTAASAMGDVSTTTYGLNQKLVLRSSGAYTQPGTAAGTAEITVYYHLVDS